MSAATITPTPSTRLATPPAAYKAPQPSIRLLYSFLTIRDFFLCILPAIAFSVAAGGVAPFMTIVLGQAFNVFADYPRDTQPTAQDKHDLLKGIGYASINLLALAIGSFALTMGMSAIWISAGERNAMRLRKRVYEAVSAREMTWFDAKLGGDADDSKDGEEKLGPGGLMAKFAKDTDDVREASSLAMGQLVQYLVTFITALVLAFRGSWALTLVILASVPVTAVIQVISQMAAGPILQAQRVTYAQSSDVISRAVSSIATVKAFNAIRHETTSFTTNLEALRKTTFRETTLWGITTGVSQFTMLSMFVQGFWFGAYLIRKGQVSFGDVVQVFWACLVAASNFHMTVPLFITLSRGKWAMVSLMTLIDPPPTELPTPRVSRSSMIVPVSPGAGPRTSFFQAGKRVGRKSAEIRKIRPSNAPAGEIVLRNVTFSYPTRPDRTALKDVSMFLPAKEMTFIVGPSGSGKSTIAQLLLRMYEPDIGDIDFDDKSLLHLDAKYTKDHIAAVAQGCVLFDMDVHKNVAMGLAGVPGRSPEDATAEEVMEACKATMVHDFVKDLPNGYQTQLGSKGANVSGGQRQRLALARAKLRDPTVLILDEATSALDPATRNQVFSAIRQWRNGKTTIVITHDLNLIAKTDFVFIMKDGVLVEQGYCEDLATANISVWKEMRQYSGDVHEPVSYGWAPEITLDTASDVGIRLDEAEQEMTERRAKHASKHASVIGAALRPASGAWMLDAINDLTRPVPPSQSVAPAEQPSSWSRESRRGSAMQRRQSSLKILPSTRKQRPSSITLMTMMEGSRESRNLQRRASLQFTPTSPSFPKPLPATEARAVEKGDITPREEAARRLSRESSHLPYVRYEEHTTVDVEKAPPPASNVPEPKSEKPTPPVEKEEKAASLLAVARFFWPTLPQKWLIIVGMIVSLVSGAMMPIFSFLFSVMLVKVASVGTSGMGPITRISLFVLLVAFGDGFFSGLKLFIMEVAGFNWINGLRRKNFPRILSQDKKWFDEPANTPERIVHILMQDGDDARALVVTVLAQTLVVVSMVTVGFIWALILGWQLTLAGLAFAPVFAIVMALQARMMAKFELRNKRFREEVARNYHDAIANIREIRSMSFESVFLRQFNDSVDSTYRAGLIGGFAEGSTVGIASALIYLAEALLFYVGALLMAKGDYTYLRMLQVLNLVAFTVTIASQLLAFVERIAKSVQAAHDFGRLTKLRGDTEESRGLERQPIDGSIVFQDVSFAYPQRPDVPVLRGLSMQLNPGESVAIVGSSGSGKSTIAALLQRLYEPSRGIITMGGRLLSATEVSHLRNNVAIVSQTPHLFDASVRENIMYGTEGALPSQVEHAAKLAHIHDFVTELPNGYDSNIGDKATLLSGGQAQRIQIARALMRPAPVLILDECTSALDPANEAAVIDTIRSIKDGRTTLMITHKVPVMRMCDRILVVQEGQIVEQGSYDELMSRRKVFYELTTAGEWA